MTLALRDVVVMNNVVYVVDPDPLKAFKARTVLEDGRQSLGIDHKEIGGQGVPLSETPSRGYISNNTIR